MRGAGGCQAWRNGNAETRRKHRLRERTSAALLCFRVDGCIQFLPPRASVGQADDSYRGARRCRQLRYFRSMRPGEKRAIEGTPPGRTPPELPAIATKTGEPVANRIVDRGPTLRPRTPPRACVHETALIGGGRQRRRRRSPFRIPERMATAGKNVRPVRATENLFLAQTMRAPPISSMAGPNASTAAPTADACYESSRSRPRLSRNNQHVGNGSSAAPATGCS
jgi:hypothetical protein